MDTKEKFNEMVAYDFSNLNLQQEGSDSCFLDCDTCDGTCECEAG